MVREEGGPTRTPPQEEPPYDECSRAGDHVVLDADHETLAAEQEKSKLKKHFGRFDMLFFLICTLVGAGHARRGREQRARRASPG